MKRLYLFVLALFMFFSLGKDSFSQITIGANPYATLADAFTAINNGVETGAITINVNASTSETGSAVLNASGTGSANYTSVLIKPTVNGVSISGNVTGALVDLSGADNVTIDGRVGATNTRQLTIFNTSTVTLSAAIKITSLGTGLGATNNIIQFCNIETGINTVTLNLYGIYIGGTTISATLGGADNDDIIISNNRITRASTGIYTRGTSTANPNINTTIANNIIGSDDPNDYITLNGVDMTNSDNLNISNNKIYNIIATSSSQLRGLFLSAGITNATINANEIGNIQNLTTSGFRCGQGIWISGTGTVNATISNNSIYGLDGHGSTTRTNNAWGIIISAGNGFNIYFNSISLTGAITATGSTDGHGGILLNSASTTGLNIRNNNLSSTMTPGNVSAGNVYNIYSSVTNTANFTDINYNNYYGSGARYLVGFLSSARATLADWQTATTKDANSISGNPLFANPNNFLAVGSSSPCLNAGTNSTGITTDILGITRSATPTIGAYENPVNLSDAGVVILYTLGYIPVNYGANHVISAVVENTGNTTLTNLNVTLDISGANSFSNTQIVASLGVGAQATVTFAPFTPTVQGTNTVEVSVPVTPGAGDNILINSTYDKFASLPRESLPVVSLIPPVPNKKGIIEQPVEEAPGMFVNHRGTNSFSIQQEVTVNSFSYAIGTTPSGGVGFTGATGDFVAKFNTAIAGTLNQINVNFNAGGQQFKLGIWDASGAGGSPGVLLDTSTTQTSAIGEFVVPLSPGVALPPGDFFVGVMQLGTTNISFAYQSESPIRSNTFFYASPTGSGTWFDFAPANPFRFMISPRFALNNDVGVSAIVNPASGQIIPAGTNMNIEATVFNFGLTSQSNVPVSLKVSDGVTTNTYGPVNTSGTPIPSGGTENVIFNNIPIPSTPGTVTFTAYTQLGVDQDRGNDTLSQSNSSQTPVTSFPFFEDFSDVTGWTNAGTNLNIWSIQNAVNPNGVPTDPALRANFFGNSSGVGNYRTPLMNLNSVLDFSGLSNPVLSFFVASRTYTDNAPDVLQVLVSTDGGATFSAPLFNKSQVGSPPLATLPPSSSSFTPANASEWRHEMVDLSAFGGQPNVMISFTGITAFGNNCWIDNVLIADVANFQSQTVTATGPYNFAGALDAYNVTVNMTTIGPAPDGVLKFIRNLSAPLTLAVPEIATNTTATAPDATIFTPDKVSPDGYYTLTYDYSSSAVYDISIDVSSYTGINNADKLYIVKRADPNSSWVCLSTTRIGNVLTASGVSGFSQFAIASDQAINPLPVELTSFTASVNRRDVNLNWVTASEINNSGFDIERKAEGSEEWTKAGNVSGNGTTTEIMNYSFTDRGLNTGKYNYRLKQIDYNGNFEFFNLVGEVNVGVPDKYDLSQNYPNPFNPVTKINVDLPFDSKVVLKIYDITGREIKTLINDVQTAGYYTLQFDASTLSSGAYFYRISAEGGNQNFVMTKKMLLVK